MEKPKPQRVDSEGEMVLASREVDLGDLDIDSMLTGDEGMEPEAPLLSQEAELSKDTQNYSRVFWKTLIAKDKFLEFEGELFELKFWTETDQTNQLYKKSVKSFGLKISVEHAFLFAKDVLRSKPNQVILRSAHGEVAIVDLKTEKHLCSPYVREYSILDIDKSTATVQIVLEHA